ncbi:DUF3574 domain-containing protein [Parvibaculum sp.]|uniref:DUF3574 domain-containing protein n=1 Tax=Parvibaculum sp. TaxID=2024848 RepID=UPI002CF55828|nr:DUF3574 domain-containing protein [Parvibaculum sp.]HUD49970.1 DUF3574 domain-containing protein [Parvibaculum sp.]
MKRFVLVCLLVFVVQPAFAGSGAIETKLYFGLGIAGGGRVTEQQWQRFLAEIVTPRFPDGLTVLSATGQWRDPKGKSSKVVSEPTRIVIIVHPETAAATKAIGEIRQTYVKRFRQQSVLQTDQPVNIVE